jgi:hypothetical protein
VRQIDRRAIEPAHRARVPEALGPRRGRLPTLDQGEPFALRSRPRPAPFYTVTFQFTERRRWNWSFLYVPSRRLMRVTTSVGTVTDARDVYWRTAPATVAEAFEVLSKQLRSFPAPRRWR